MQIRKKQRGNGHSLRDTGQNVSIDYVCFCVERYMKVVHFGVYLRMGHCDICINMVCYVKLYREVEYNKKVGVTSLKKELWAKIWIDWVS